MSKNLSSAIKKLLDLDLGEILQNSISFSKKIRLFASDRNLKDIDQTINYILPMQDDFLKFNSDDRLDLCNLLQLAHEYSKFLTQKELENIKKETLRGVIDKDNFIPKSKKQKFTSPNFEDDFSGSSGGKKRKKDTSPIISPSHSDIEEDAFIINELKNTKDNKIKKKAKNKKKLLDVAPSSEIESDSNEEDEEVIEDDLEVSNN